MKGKGAKASHRVDRAIGCTRALNFSYKPASSSSDKAPCSNVPLPCPLCPEKSSPAVWRYNLEAHLRKVHSAAAVERYRSMWELLDAEKKGMERVWVNRKKTAKKRKPNAPKITASEAHKSVAPLHRYVSSDYCMRSPLGSNRLASSAPSDAAVLDVGGETDEEGERGEDDDDESDDALGQPVDHLLSLGDMYTPSDSETPDLGTPVVGLRELGHGGGESGREALVSGVVGESSANSRSTPVSEVNGNGDAGGTASAAAVGSNGECLGDAAMDDGRPGQRVGRGTANFEVALTAPSPMEPSSSAQAPPSALDAETPASSLNEHRVAQKVSQRGRVSKRKAFESSLTACLCGEDVVPSEDSADSLKRVVQCRKKGCETRYVSI